MSRARPSCRSDASASNAITKFSSAITRMRSCTNSALVSSGILDGASAETDPPCGPAGPAPPSLSHLESAICHCREEVADSGFFLGMGQLPEARESIWCVLAPFTLPFSQEGACHPGGSVSASRAVAYEWVEERHGPIRPGRPPTGECRGPCDSPEHEQACPPAGSHKRHPSAAPRRVLLAPGW